MNDLAKNLLLWLVIAVVLMAVFNSFSTPGAASAELTYNQFINEVKDGRVSEVRHLHGGQPRLCAWLRDTRKSS